jgi:hypothetical protein
MPVEYVSILANTSFTKPARWKFNHFIYELKMLKFVAKVLKKNTERTEKSQYHFHL